MPRLIDTAYVRIHGDEDAGIFDGLVTISGMAYDPSIFEDETADLEHVRQDLVDAFEAIYCERCSVLFDFECEPPEQGRETR